MILNNLQKLESNEECEQIQENDDHMSLLKLADCTKENFLLKNFPVNKLFQELFEMKRKYEKKTIIKNLKGKETPMLKFREFKNY